MSHKEALIIEDKIKELQSKIERYRRCIEICQLSEEVVRMTISHHGNRYSQIADFRNRAHDYERAIQAKGEEINELRGRLHELDKA